MSPTRTGFDPWLSETGAAYAQELLRQGTYMLAEVTSEPVQAGTLPVTVDVLRAVETAPGSTAHGIAPTYAAAAGLAGIPAVLFLPAVWNDKPSAGGIVLKDTERLVVLVDVPASATVGADIVLPSDRLRFADPVYGAVEFRVVQTGPYKAAGLIYVRVDYARETK